MSRAARSVLALSVLAGCTGEPGAGERRPTKVGKAKPSVESYEGPAPELGDRVLVREGTSLYIAPSSSAPHFEVPELDANRVVTALEVVMVAGPFVGVETLGPADEPACAGRFGVEDDYRLRFFVRVSELAAALTAPLHVEYEDGAVFDFAPGVEVRTRGDQAELIVAGYHFDVPAAEVELGAWFASRPLLGEMPEVEHAPILRFGGRQIDPNTPRPGLGRAVESRTLDDGTKLVTLAGPCGRFTLVDAGDEALSGHRIALPQMARTFDPERAEARTGLLEPKVVDEPDCAAPRWVIEAGTELEWAVGGRAGQSRTRQVLPASAEQRAEQLCFEVGGFGLCVNAAEATRGASPGC